jgi:hypothetical protein
MTNFTHSPSVLTLDNSVSLYVPTVYQNHSPIEKGSIDQAKEACIKALTKFFGGVTETTGIGYFQHESGIVQEEKVFILNSFASDSDLLKHTLQLRTLATLLGQALKQESTLLVVNGVAGFYEANERWDKELK